MHIVDHVLIFVLLVAQPVYGAYEARQIRKDAQSGRPLDRIRWYRETVLWEWGFFVVLLIAWLQFSRSFADLGFIKPGGVGFWVGAMLVIPLIGYLVVVYHRIKKMNGEERAKNIEHLGDLKVYLPHSDRDLKYFTGVSATAGLVEEVVYRGFVIWYFSQFIPIWPAVIASSLLFGLAHSYQGLKGMLNCGTVGLGFGALYVLTGSIWLPIIAHFLFDALQGLSLRELLRSDNGSEFSPQEPARS